MRKDLGRKKDGDALFQVALDWSCVNEGLSIIMRLHPAAVLG